MTALALERRWFIYYCHFNACFIILIMLLFFVDALSGIRLLFYNLFYDLSFCRVMMMNHMFNICCVIVYVGMFIFLIIIDWS